MIDISEKPIVKRKATAEGTIKLRKETIHAILDGKVKKGDVIEISKTTGIQWAKRTWDLIPHCHQIPLEYVEADAEIGEESIKFRCEVSASYGTGVEMEALSCVSGSLLNVWDMVKYLEKDKTGNYPETRISEIRVTEKTKEPI